jgi:hypothetical protein
VRGGRENALKQVALLHDFHAFEREVDYLGMWIRGGLRVLSGDYGWNEKESADNPPTVLPGARRYLASPRCV